MTFQTAKNIIHLTRASYNNIATSFSDSRSGNWPEVESLVKKYVQDKNSILDLGCGNGRLVQLLKNYKNINYTGLDNSEKLILKAKENLKDNKLINLKNKIQFICNDILNLNQFESNSFDKIFLIASFNHMPSQELRQKVMANLYRILKKDGILIITTPIIGHWSARLKTSFGKFPREKYGIFDENHLHFFTIDSFKKMLEECGYFVEYLGIDPIGGGFPKLSRIFSLIFPNLFAYQIVVKALPDFQKSQ